MLGFGRFEHGELGLGADYAEKLQLRYAALMQQQQKEKEKEQQREQEKSPRDDADDANAADIAEATEQMHEVQLDESSVQPSNLSEQKSSSRDRSPAETTAKLMDSEKVHTPLTAALTLPEPPVPASYPVQKNDVTDEKGRSIKSRLSPIEYASKFVCSPEKVPDVDPRKVVKLCCGNFHSAFIDVDGNLWTFGGDGSGQCGHGEAKDQWTPRCLKSFVDKRVQDVACGKSHTLVVAADHVYAWGKANSGQLGFGGSADQMNPCIVPALQNIRIKQVACGGCHSMALSAAGDVYVWGRPEFGRLGDNIEKLTPMRPMLVVPLSGRNVVKICCGHYHSMAILSTGELFVWGSNEFKQLGTGSEKSESEPVPLHFPRNIKIVDVAAGAYHSLAITNQGQVFSWGLNNSGQLGLGDREDRRVPCEIETFSMISSLKTRVFMVSCGLFHTAALTIDGKLYTFGDSRYGQLGHGDYETREYPSRVQFGSPEPIAYVACGNWHTIVVEGKVKPNLRPKLDVDLKETYDPSSISPASVGDNTTSAFGFLFALCTGARHVPKAQRQRKGLDKDAQNNTFDDQSQLESSRRRQSSVNRDTEQQEYTAQNPLQNEYNVQSQGPREPEQSSSQLGNNLHKTNADEKEEEPFFTQEDNGQDQQEHDEEEVEDEELQGQSQTKHKGQDVTHANSHKASQS